jgi:hypothetical protein
VLAIIGIILTIIYIIWLGRLIEFGVKTATRIAVASEQSAANTAMLVALVQAQLKPPPSLPAEEIGLSAVERELNNTPRPSSKWNINPNNFNN